MSLQDSDADNEPLGPSTGMIWLSIKFLYSCMSIVTCQPWPLSAAPYDAAAASRLFRLLGNLFDTTAVSPRYLRSLANAWSQWAGLHFAALRSAWHAVAVTQMPII